MLNLIIEMSGIIFCVAALLQVLFAEHERQTRLHFLLFYISLILLIGSNMAGMLMRGRPGPLWRAALYASNFTEFLASALLTYIVTHYLLSVVDPQRKCRRSRILLHVILLLYAASLCVSQFTGLYYVLDENNVYHRTAAYPLTYLFIAGMFAIACDLLIRFRKTLTKAERIAFGIYYFVPTVAMVLQIRYYGINFVVFSTIVAGVAMYVFIVTDQTMRYYQQQMENERLKTQIMLSQIKPHFLYNALGTIEELCDSNPTMAKQATAMFSEYLRGNMDAIDRMNAIPFIRELEHTKLYLEIEKLRFRDALTIHYDIACTDFSLPALTLEPLVENAVRHGIRKNERGVGTVSIATREAGDHYEISVTDDGPGFNPSEPPDDGRTHVGIRNVRDRVRGVCGGSVEIDSAPGQGTTATIILPKTR